MKKLIILFICFLFTNSANAQYVIDWKNAPLNPIPFEYTRNHLNINGNVISREGGLNYYSFNKKGFMTEYRYADIREKYTYNDKNQLTSMENPSGKFIFDYNNQGQLIRFGKDRKDRDDRAFTYNQLGLLYEIKNAHSGELIEVFKYSADNRIFLNESYKEGKLLSTTHFIYQKTDKGLEVKVAVIKGKEKDIRISIYNDRGDCISREGTPIKLTYNDEKNISVLEVAGNKVNYYYDYYIGFGLFD